ncbi:LpxL/LpxP family acyltransferase [Undibacterium parvum]|uniref:Acyltransferase n=2 Tax=Undibacterium TaxID=401469 RepID=A0A6M4A6T1_9BURK|nr:acyltransferase [Undibacterium parvum]AZP12074.1 acyltransferase [Undibacterium parvum]QJQ06420.1 acyltransferase [Undibacterium piscinae]
MAIAALALAQMADAMSEMMKEKNQHWASLNELSFITGMRVLFWIFRLFGRWPFRVVLYPVLLWYVMTKPRPRAASKDYLRRISGYVAVPTGIPGVILHFAAFAENILDKMLLWGGLYKTEDVQFHGVAKMEQLIRERRGAVLVCSHLGNLELCRVLSLKRPGLRLTILVHTKHAKAFNQLLAALNPASQLNLMQVSEITPATAMILAEKVEQGEFIVIAGDRVPLAQSPRVALVNFFGAQAAFPVGPYVLASILHCPIYMLFSHQAGKHAEIHFELLHAAPRLPREGREQVLADLAGSYANRLEYHCQRVPLQWFNFYDFWHLPELDTTDAVR